MDEKNLDIIKDYKYGFSTDIENIRRKTQLKEVIKVILNLKKEPKWLLDYGGTTSLPKIKRF